MALRSVPPPPESGDPFDGLVLDQAFVAAAKIYEDRLEVHRRDLGLDSRTMAVVPALTRRGVVTTAVFVAGLVAIMLLLAPAWHLVTAASGWVDGSDRSGATGTPQRDDWMPADRLTPPSPIDGASRAGSAAPGPVLRNGELVDPFQDPFGR